jgi:hypothetical protein
MTRTVTVILLVSFWCWSSVEGAPQVGESAFSLAENRAWLETGATQVDLAGAAEQLVSSVKETHYQHKTHVDVSQGVYDLDCSGLVDYLLKRVAPDRFAQIPIEPGHSRPRAVMYYQFISGLNQQPATGWVAVQKLGDAKRGDIIAWEKTASSEGDTGHVVIVAQDPVRQPDGLYAVAVYDSSGIHHEQDTRSPTTSGVGRGIIFFRVSEAGQPTAFQFNRRANFHEEPIAIGRLN